MLKETLARNFAPDVRKIWAGRGGKLNPEFAGACLNLVYECGISVEKLSLAIVGRRRNALRRERPLTGRNEHDNKAGWRRRGVRALA